MQTPKILIECEELSKSYDSKRIFEGLTTSIFENEFLCLLGPSGCGKSTFLRILANLESQTSGIISRKTSKSFSFVFQDPELLSWRNTLENVRLPLELAGKHTKQEQNLKSEQALAKVGLKKAANLYPHQLSGGMKMRASIARALVLNPELLFMDEPFSALDEVTRFDLQVQLKELCEQQNITVVFVTHSVWEASFLADRILIMSSAGHIRPFESKISYSQRRTETLRETPEFHRWTSKISKALRESSL